MLGGIFIYWISFSLLAPFAVRWVAMHSYFPLSILITQLVLVDLFFAEFLGVSPSEPLPPFCFRFLSCVYKFDQPPGFVPLKIFFQVERDTLVLFCRECSFFPTSFLFLCRRWTLEGEAVETPPVGL